MLFVIRIFISLCYLFYGRDKLNRINQLAISPFLVHVSINIHYFSHNLILSRSNVWTSLLLLLLLLSSSSSSSSSCICHGVGPLFDPFRSQVSRSLFKGLPWFLLPVGEFRGILFTCCNQLLSYSSNLSKVGVIFNSFAICAFVL